jgi:aphidicolan-16beta-ol synthase/syn-copalyl-diphosphate synthase
MIPLTWTACNNRAGMPASCAFMFDMMFLSVLNFQVDEFMESVAGPAFEPHFDELKSLIDDVFPGYTCNGIANGSYTSIIQTPNGQLPSPTIHDEVRRPLERYIKHLLQHDAVRQASSRDVRALRQELKRFLHAHVIQAADNARFAKNTHQPFEDPNGDFFRWVHTTSADHTSCPSAFAFVSCLISFSFSSSLRNSSATSTTPANSTVSNKQPDAWPIAEQKYLAADLCRHLSTMCRMYNDYGSIRRDQKEANLNSVNFSEFANTDAGGVGEESAKAALFRLAEYERHSVEHAFAQLVDVSVKAGNNAAVRNRTASQMGVWRLFVDVTDLYGQIYVVRDIASRMK